MTIKLIILSIVIIILLILPQAAKRIVYKKLTTYLSKGAYEAFEKLLDGFICTFSFRPFNREYMRLTAYLMQQDRDNIEAQFDTMFKRFKMKDEQKVSLAQRGFYFYLENNNLAKTKKMYNVCLKADKQTNDFHTMELMYSIFVLKKSDYLQEIRERLEALKKQKNVQDAHAQEVRIGIFEYMLALQYAYQKNKKASKQYLAAALKHCESTPYEKQISTLLEGDTIWN